MTATRRSSRLKRKTGEPSERKEDNVDLGVNENVSKRAKTRAGGPAQEKKAAPAKRSMATKRQASAGGKNRNADHDKENKRAPAQARKTRSGSTRSSSRIKSRASINYNDDALDVDLYYSYDYEQDYEEEKTSAAKTSSKSKSKSTSTSTSTSASTKSNAPGSSVDEGEESIPSSIKKMVVKGRAAVDERCPIASSVHVYDDGKDVYDTMLNQTNIGQNNNKFYMIQLLEADDVRNRLYYVWFRYTCIHT